ncbi:uncharacterized protein LOC122392653 isoform X2 [Amphibalanus amphitrite]|uniref:uncharacterized protein LOC122392653 isoform X2 n=1 Tax=Amphibalanus amphitrite TaxID=1232801 RepID=UPI001C8FAF07|nr:uncharacterized protein LOC122392653 isoform X2 [Amphibalanus amphitrite]
MHSRMGPSRGHQRILVTVAVLVALAGVVQFWRLRTVNADLTNQLVRVERLLQEAEKKSSMIDSQRKETSEDLKKVNAKLQQLQITKDEDSMRCKQLQEDMEEIMEKKSALQKELDDDKATHNGELHDMASKLKTLQLELTENRRQSDAEVAALRQQLAEAEQTVGDASSCRAQLTHAQTELIKCQSMPAVQPAAPRQPGTAGSGPAAAAVVPGDNGSKWPGLVAPKPQLGQQLFESAGLSGGFQQAQGQVVAARRVLPTPPGAAAAAAGPKSSSSTSSVRPAVADALETLDKPQGGEEAAEGAGALAAEGAGVLAPPHQLPERQEEKEEEEGGEGEQQEEGDQDGDGGIQYPMDDGKADAMDDHPDTDNEAKDAELIKGLKELSNKSGQGADQQPGPAEGELSGPEMVGAVPPPDLTGGVQPHLPLR